MLVHILCTYTHKNNDNLPMRGRQQGEEKENHNAVDTTAGNTARSDSYLCRWATKLNLSKSLCRRPETGDRRPGMETHSYVSSFFNRTRFTTVVMYVVGVFFNAPLLVMFARCSKGTSSVSGIYVPGPGDSRVGLRLRRPV